MSQEDTETTHLLSSSSTSSSAAPVWSSVATTAATALSTNESSWTISRGSSSAVRHPILDHPHEDPFIHFSYADWNHRRRVLMGSVAALILCVVVPFVSWTLLINNYTSHSSPNHNTGTSAVSHTTNNSSSYFPSILPHNHSYGTNSSSTSTVPNFEHGSSTIQIHYENFYNPVTDKKQQQQQQHHSKQDSKNQQQHDDDHHHHAAATADTGYCEANSLYSVFTLQMAYELPIPALLAPSLSTFTSSSMRDDYLKLPFAVSAITSSSYLSTSTNPSSTATTTNHAVWYAVANNSWSILQFQPSLYPPGLSDINRLIHHPLLHDSKTTVSNYHAIFQLQSTFYIVRQSVRHFLKRRRQLETQSTDQDHIEEVEEEQQQRKETNEVDTMTSRDMKKKKKNSIKHQHKKHEDKQENVTSKETTTAKKHDQTYTSKDSDTTTHETDSSSAGSSYGNFNNDNDDDVFSYHAIVQEISFTSTSDVYDILDECRCDMAFEGSSR